jgi:hypothetical protein
MKGEASFSFGEVINMPLDSGGPFRYKTDRSVCS